MAYERRYEVRLLPGAVRDFGRLDRSTQRQIRRQLGKLARSPELGKPLGVRAGMDLTGFRALRAVRGQYRIVYRVVEAQGRVEVWAIGKRERGSVYYTLASRLGEV